MVHLCSPGLVLDQFLMWIVVEFATPPFGFDFTSATLTTSLRLFPLNSAGVSSHESGQEP